MPGGQRSDPKLGLSQWTEMECQGRKGCSGLAFCPCCFCYRDAMPNIFSIHLGDNDLGLVQVWALVMQVVEDLQVIKARWPGIWVIWSTIVLRLS